MADDQTKANGAEKKPVEEKPVAEEKPVKVSQPEPAAATPAKPAGEPPTSPRPAPATDSGTPAGTDAQGRQLYKVKCANCGKDAQVPFKPFGDRPVYCRDCYLKRKGGSAGGPSRA